MHRDNPVILQQALRRFHQTLVERGTPPTTLRARMIEENAAGVLQLMPG